MILFVGKTIHRIVFCSSSLYPVDPGLTFADQFRLKAVVNCPTGDCNAICRKGRSRGMSIGTAPSLPFSTLRVAPLR